jgi:GR25 family glycosyltransferase involved in LPS biosynthesis
MAWNLDQIPIVCLNLDRRVDRWERVQASPGFAEFPRIERWSGTDGKTLDITNDPRVSIIVKYNVANKTRRAHEYINTPGAVGCYLSHASVYEWMSKQNNADVVLIFEDDVYAVNRKVLEEGLEEAIKFMTEKPDWRYRVIF